MVDLLSIIPFYIELGTGQGKSLSIIRIFRLTRLVRLIKSGKGKFQRELRVLSMTLHRSAPMCLFLFAFFSLLMIVFGAIAYLLEGGQFKVTEDYPDGVYMRPNLYVAGQEETPYLSVLHGMYYAVVTSTTVGYGDFYPTTYGGRLWGCLCTILGIAILALPLSVIATHFSNEYEKVFPVKDDSYVAPDGDKVAAGKSTSQYLDIDMSKAKKCLSDLESTILCLTASAASVRAELERYEALLKNKSSRDTLELCAVPD